MLSIGKAPATPAGKARSKFATSVVNHAEPTAFLAFFNVS